KAEAIPLLGKLLFTVDEEIVDEGLYEEVFLHGSASSTFLINTYNRLKNIFARGPDAEIIPFHFPPPEPITPDVFATGPSGQVFAAGVQAAPRAVSGGGVAASIKDFEDDI